MHKVAIAVSTNVIFTLANVAFLIWLGSGADFDFSVFVKDLNT